MISFLLAFVVFVSVPSEVDDYLVNPVSTSQPDACVQAEFSRAKNVLPADTSIRWFWSDLTPHNASGLAFTGSRSIVLSTTQLWCGYVPAVAFHEWAHIATADAYGSITKAQEQLGELEIELVADCISRTLTDRTGSRRFAPYTSKHGGCPRHLKKIGNHILARYGM